MSEQAAEALRHYLSDNKGAFFKLPSMRDLAKQLGVSLVNAQKAVQVLRQEGLLEVIHGKAIFSKPVGGRRIENQSGKALGLICYSERVAMDFLRGENTFYSKVIDGAMQKAGMDGWKVFMHWLPSGVLQNPGQLDEIRRFAERNGMEGLLLLCLTEGDVVRWIVEQAGIPCVLIDHWCEQVAVDTVNPDNRAAAYLGTRHLIEAGHRDIAYIVHHRATVNPPRLQGYLDALKDAGIPVRDELIRPFEMNEWGGEQGIRALVCDGVAFSAVMAFDEVQALGALRVLGELGRDIELVTFGTANAFNHPRCAVVSLQPSLLGSMAVERLILRLRQPDLSTEELVSPVRLIPPAVGPARAAAPLPSAEAETVDERVGVEPRTKRP